MATVARFNVTPVKSTALHHPEQIELTQLGVEGDHRFLFLERDGTRLSGALKAPLLGVRADHDPGEETLTLTFPGGTRVEGSAAPEGEPFVLRLYDREALVREVPGAIAESMSRHVRRSLRLARVERPGYAGGNHRVTILSLASVEDLGRRAGAERPPDPRRFRMLIELGGCEPYEEDRWSGGRVRLGGAVLRVGDPVPRCVIVTRDPDSGAPDFPTLDVLAGYRKRGNELIFGVYADIERPGPIRLGDAVEVLDRRADVRAGNRN
jgi:uncharacterized protein YcbX